jgi:hypothetical protein
MKMTHIGGFKMRAVILLDRISAQSIKERVNLALAMLSVLQEQIESRI